MTDIVEKLRRGVDTNEPPDKTDRVMTKAADEIERLRATMNRAFEHLSQTDIAAEDRAADAQMCLARGLVP